MIKYSFSFRFVDTPYLKTTFSVFASVSWQNGVETTVFLKLS